MSDNIIVGPWAVTAPKGVRVLQDEQVRELVTNELVNELAGELFDHMAELGYDVDISDEVDYSKDLAMVVESIKAYILKTNKEYHPVQEVSNKLFDYNDDGRLFTHPKLNIKFKAVIDPAR